MGELECSDVQIALQIDLHSQASYRNHPVQRNANFKLKTLSYVIFSITVIQLFCLHYMSNFFS